MMSGKIYDPILGKIVGKNEFDEKEYEELRKQHEAELQIEWEKIRQARAVKEKEENSVTPSPTERKTQLQNQLQRLQEDLNLLTSLGDYNKYLFEKEKRNLEEQIARLQEELNSLG